MQYRELGKSGLMVTPMAFGGWPIGGGGEWGKTLPDETYLGAIRAALEGGSISLILRSFTGTAIPKSSSVRRSRAMTARSWYFPRSRSRTADARYRA